MEVLKRNGKREDVSFDKITARVKKLCYGLDSKFVDSIEISKRVILGLYNGVTTSELDNLAAETAASLAAVHPDNAILAARIAVSNLHKNTNKSFSETMEGLYQYIDPITNQKAGLISDETIEVIRQNADRLDSAIIYDRDYSFDYFGFKTLERSYLLRMNKKVVERPQHLLMRASDLLQQSIYHSLDLSYQQALYRIHPCLLLLHALLLLEEFHRVSHRVEYRLP